MYFINSETLEASLLSYIFFCFVSSSSKLFTAFFPFKNYSCASLNLVFVFSFFEGWIVNTFLKDISLETERDEPASLSTGIYESRYFSGGPLVTERKQ